MELRAHGATRLGEVGAVAKLAKLNIRFYIDKVAVQLLRLHIPQTQRADTRGIRHVAAAGQRQQLRMDCGVPAFEVGP